MSIPRPSIGFRAGLVAIGLLPVAVSPLPAETIVAASSGFAAVAFDSGGILAYGRSPWSNPTPVLAGANWRSLAVDDSRWQVVDASGRLLLGTSFLSTPVPFGTDTDWKLGSIGWNVAAGVKTDGSLWAWDAFPGTIGGPATSSTPLRVGDANDWKEVVCGRYFRLALKTDGSLWAWGWNNHGSVGDGTNLHRESPVRVGNDNDWTSISCVGFTSFGVKNDGSLWSWGASSSDFASAPAPWAPGRLGSDTDWSRVAMNPQGFVYLALKTDGSLWSWGQNSSGQLGQGDKTARTHPTRVGTETGWKHIHASSNHCIAMKEDGSIWQWGGRVETSDILSSNVPVDRSAFYSRAPRLRLPDFTGSTSTWAWPGHVTGENATLPLRIFNDGIEPLVVNSLSLPSPFTSGPLPEPIPGFSSATVALTLDTTTISQSSGQILVNSNAQGANPVGRNLSWLVLSTDQDRDNDGLSDAAELRLAALGFNYENNESAKVASFLAKARVAGFVTQERVKELRVLPVEILPGVDATSRMLVLGIIEDQTNGEIPLEQNSLTPAGDAIEVEVPIEDGREYLRIRPR